MTLDEHIFYFINSTCGCAPLDCSWHRCGGSGGFGCRSICSWLFLLVELQKRGLMLLAFLALTVGLADFTSSELIKKTVRRPRPCADAAFFEKVNLRLERCGGGWSFPSSHAANHFAAAVFLGLLFGRRPRWVRPALFGWATSVALAQVYVGVHWPTDVAAGAAVGMLAGAIGFWAARLADERLAATGIF